MSWENIGTLHQELRENKPQTGQCDDGSFYEKVCEVLECQTERIATQQAQIDQNTADIQLGGGGATGGNNYNQSGSIEDNNTVTLNNDVDGNASCNSTVGWSVSISGQNGDDNGGAIAAYSGDVVFYCDGTEIGRQPFAIGSGVLSNGQSYSDSQSGGLPSISCLGVISVATETNEKIIPTGGGSTGGCTATADITSNCTTIQP